MGIGNEYGTLVELHVFAEMNNLSFAVYRLGVLEPSTVYPTDKQPDACNFYVRHCGSMGADGHFDLLVTPEVIIRGYFYKKTTFESYVYALLKTCINTTKSLCKFMFRLQKADKIVPLRKERERRTNVQSESKCKSLKV